MKHIIASIVMTLSLSAFADMKIKKGQAFPSFDVKALGKNDHVQLHSLKGKVVVVDFWASWCGPCKEELPALSKLAKKFHGKKLEIIGVNVDDEEKNAISFAHEHKVGLKLAYDQGKKLTEQCNLETMPTSFVLDKKGVVKFIHTGYSNGDIEKFEKEINSLL